MVRPFRPGPDSFYKGVENGVKRATLAHAVNGSYGQLHLAELVYFGMLFAAPVTS